MLGLSRRWWASGLRLRYSFYCLGAALAIAAGILTVLSVASDVQAQPRSTAPSADASCAALAGVNRTATNGSDWGQTILPGHGQPGGWFGVDVCANGISVVSGNSSSVSCDHMPTNWNRTGCAPGEPTSDGYGWTFQCPELVVRFSAWAFGDSPGDWGRTGWGNAPDLWESDNHPTDFVTYANGSSEPPVPGDILVWGSLDSKGQPWPAGPDGEHGGHVAVVAAVTNGFVVTAEQNVTWGIQDHPSDRLALSDVEGRWILSGSQVPATQLPTYRWQSTMGDSRATYGWLHSVRNTGHFPSSSGTTSAAAGGSNGTSASLPQQPSGGLPSLDTTTVVTGTGELADLVWSESDFFNPASTADGPHAAIRSLGAPPGTALMTGWRPATISLSDGSSLSYIVGMNGHLFVLDLVPTAFGVLWTDLGHPAGTLLSGPISASTFAGGLGVVALGKDGNLWWRTGVSGQPGTWQEIGRPNGTSLTQSFVLAGAPGEGVPLILAVGTSGRLYQRIWIDAQFAADGSVTVPAGWSNWTTLSLVPSNLALGGTLVAATETAKSVDYIGSWPDAPLDICLFDTSGRIWWLRTAAIQAGWQVSQVGAPRGLTALLGAAIVDGPGIAADPERQLQELQAYAAGSGGSAMVSLPVPENNMVLAPKGDWTLLPPPVSPDGAEQSGAVVALGQGRSAIVAASGGNVLVGGTPQALSLLLPSASLTEKTWTSVGVDSTAPAFADTFMERKVDSRWEVSGTTGDLVATTRGLSLSVGSSGAAALLQAAQAGDFVLSVYTRLPNNSRVESGLVLYTDDNDWLTLLLNQQGHISFCGEVRQRVMPCTTLTMPASAKVNGVWLRIAYQGDRFAGTVSQDAVTWQPVGSWTPLSTGSGSAPAMSGAESQSSLAFTSWGILSLGTIDNPPAAWFSDFAISPGGS